MSLNLIDGVIAIGALLAIGNGYRRGFWLSLSHYAGMLIGVLIGAALAPAATDLLGLRGSARAFGAVGVLLLGGTAGSTLGYRLARPIRLALLARAGPRRLDSLLGSLFSAGAVLAVAWFLGLSFHRGPSAELARLIQRSTILRALDAVAPRPPGFLARVEKILSGVPFPPVFSGLEPLIFPPPEAVPASADTPGIRAAASLTVKVAGRGCGGTVFGSGFPIAPSQVLTNAHVVAGTSGTTVSTPDGQTARAAVVLFDPERDIAILNVPALRLGVPAMADAGRGTQGAVIGYPGGGPESISPALVNSSVQAEGRDIYGQNLVVRQIWIVQAPVQPGDSGGPLVDRNGNVIGVVFGASTTQRGQAYALTDAEAAPDIEQARGQTQPVRVGPCAG